MASMVFTSSALIAQSSFVKRLRTNSKYSGSSWVPKSSVKVSSCVQQLSYKNISVESSKSSFIQGDGFSAFSLPKISRVLPISKYPSLNAITLPPGPRGENVFKNRIYRFTAKQNGKDKAFTEFQGKPGKILLIVNIPEQSSQWKNSQIKYLNYLYAKYKLKQNGFEIIGFLYDKRETPGHKDIDNSEEITEKAEFPVFDKVELNDKHKKVKWFFLVDQEKRNKDVWYFLKENTPWFSPEEKPPGGGEEIIKPQFPVSDKVELNDKHERGQDVTQAFQKFLVDSEGVPRIRFRAAYKDEVEKAIKRYLG